MLSRWMIINYFYSLTLAKKIYDMSYWLDKPMFQELKNTDLFKTVKVSGLSIAWLHGQDLCPDELYEDSETIR